MEAGTPDLIKLEDLEAASGRLTGRKHVLSITVENKPGVLARIAGLFSRRGFNIDTLAVGPTEDPDIVRITLTVDGAVHPIDQVTKQLHKLVNVIKIRDMEPGRDDRPGDGAVQGLGPDREPRRDHAVRRDLPRQDRRRLAPLADDRGHRQRRQDRGLRADDPPARPDRDGAHGRGRDPARQARQPRAAIDARRRRACSTPSPCAVEDAGARGRRTLASATVAGRFHRRQRRRARLPARRRTAGSAGSSPTATASRSARWAAPTRSSRAAPSASATSRATARSCCATPRSRRRPACPPAPGRSGPGDSPSRRTAAPRRSGPRCPRR